MTGEEAKKEIIDMANALQLIPNTPKGKAVSMALKALEQTRWIPVSERLPKAFEYCLWTTAEGDVIYHHWDGQISKYKAWMPLPEPYITESEG